MLVFVQTQIDASSRLDRHPDDERTGHVVVVPQNQVVGLHGHWSRGPRPHRRMRPVSGRAGSVLAARGPGGVRPSRGHGPRRLRRRVDRTRHRPDRRSPGGRSASPPAPGRSSTLRAVSRCAPGSHRHPRPSWRSRWRDAAAAARTRPDRRACGPHQPVPGAGIEPARPCGQRGLSPPRLPVPPPGRVDLQGTASGGDARRRRA